MGSDPQEYGYDNLNRLEKRKIGQDWMTVATYSSDGNILTKEGVTGSFNYAGSSASPHAVTEANGWAIGYDSNGNMTTRTKAGESWNFTWTTFNQPKLISAVIDGVTSTSEFVYDSSLGRVAQRKVVNGATATRVHYVLGAIEQEQVSVAGPPGSWEVTKTTI